MRAAGFGMAALLLAWLIPPAAAALSSGECGRVVVFTLPGVTWSMVQQQRPPVLLDLAADGAVGSLSMVSNEGNKSLGAAYVTVGAGSRADEPRAGLATQPETGRPVARNVTVADVGALRRLASASGSSTRPGALAEELGSTVGAVGNGATEGTEGYPTPVLAALDAGGRVDFAATGRELLQPNSDAPGGVSTDRRVFDAAVREVIATPCSVAIVEQGDLSRADAHGNAEDRARALQQADQALGRVRRRLDSSRDLLLVLSPTSPAAEAGDHLGIAVAAGRGFDAGAELTSASTRRSGIVTLVDVAPTVLAARGLEAPTWMTGRAWIGRPSESPATRVAEAVELDRESVFALGVQSSIVTGFIVVQGLVYLGALALLARSRGTPLGAGPGRAVELSALAVVCFPVASYLASPLPAHELGTAGLVAVMLGLDAILVGLLYALPLAPLERLLGAGLVTVSVLAADIATGGELQLNALFGNYPVVGGRFAGLGNTGFAILAGASLLSGALVAQLWGSERWARPAVALLFIGTVVVDGAPSLGSDVGGVLALVPVLGLSFALLWGRRPTLRMVVAIVLAGGLILALFTVMDLARPPASRTHLGRLAEAVSDRGLQPVLDAIARKGAANLGIFRLSVWSFFAPVVVAICALILARWSALARSYPKLRIGLLMMVALAVLGSALNDSGIVIGALMLPFLLTAVQLAASCVWERSA